MCLTVLKSTLHNGFQGYDVPFLGGMELVTPKSKRRQADDRQANLSSSR